MQQSSVERVRDALVRSGHADTIAMFPEGTRTSQDAAAAVGCSVAQIAKSIALRADNEVVLVIASGANRVDLDKVSALAGRTVRSADGRWVRDTTGFAIGGVPPVGHAARPRIFIDADLMQYDAVWAAAGSPRHVFRTTPSDLARLTDGEIADVKEG
jgi:prolyl-tRNA editing enzyme YbaK/EbsC (Cys-tRNA(Pro) deacylase)